MPEIFDISLTEAQTNMYMSQAQFPLYCGGFGCIRGSTKIMTEYGPLAISDIDRPMLVLSYDAKNNQFVQSLSGGAFPKGRDYLYQIVTTQGEFVASEFHQVFCADYKYYSVRELRPGTEIYLKESYPSQSSSEPYPVACALNDPHYRQRVANYLGDYAVLARQYGQQFLGAEDNGPASSPLLLDALGSGLSSSQEGDHNQVLTHTHPAVLSDRTYTHHSESLLPPPEACGADFEQALHSAHTSRNTQQSVQSPSMCIGRHTNPQYNPNHTNETLLDSPQSNPVSIISITKLKHKEVYYDMQVLNTNNYICAEGFIHHNSGKSHVMGLTAATYATHSSSALIGVYEPDHNLLRRVAIPRVQFWLTQMGYSYQINKTENVLYTNGSGIGDFIFKSLTDPESLIGYETYANFIDELDTLNTDKAEDVFDKLLGRNRQNIVDVPRQYKVYNAVEDVWECVNKTCSYSTPEGFKFCYKMWSTDSENATLNPEFKIYRGHTEDNPTLTRTWINQLKAKYSALKLEAYMKGNFVNFTAGTVYYTFIRVKHKSFETVQYNDILHIGVDFNVGNCSAVIIVQRGDTYHAVAEIKEALDTPLLIKEILDRWPLHKKIVYPDATGVKRSSSNSAVSKTDISLLRLAGLQIRARSVNPLIRDRVACVNNLIEKGRFYISETGCPTYIKHVEQQAYVKCKPDKDSNNDHLPDAGGYALAYLEDIRRPTMPLKYKFATRA